MRIFKKIFKLVFITLICLIILDIFTLIFFSLYHPKIKNADAAIILGAAINTPALYNRSLKGLELYRAGKIDALILSGGKISKQDISEAEYMQKVLVKNGGAEAPTILEEGSRNTYENIKNSKNLSPQTKSLVVVSDRFHLARGVLLAYRAGFGPVFWESPSGKYYSFFEWLYYYARELAALIVYLPRLVFF